jgi:hypothetical protein
VTGFWGDPRAKGRLGWAAAQHAALDAVSLAVRGGASKFVPQSAGFAEVDAAGNVNVSKTLNSWT